MLFPYFPNEDPMEDLDYSETFADLLEPGISLRSADVEIESASNGENPFALTISYTSLAISGANPPGIIDTVVFWLNGGTNGVTYTIKITATDTQGTPRDRIFVRRATITINPQ